MFSTWCGLWIFKDLPRRTVSDKVLGDKSFSYFADKCQHVLASMVCRSFDEETSDSAAKSKIRYNQKLAEELNKPINSKFEKRKVHSSFIDNIWGAELAVRKSISKLNKRIWFLLGVFDIFSKHACILKNKKGTTVTNAFRNI